MGGKLRAEPSIHSQRVGSTYENQAIIIIRETRILMEQYPWFEIEAYGIVAYQWGVLFVMNRALARLIVHDLQQLM